MYFAFPRNPDALARAQEFCKANGINPRAPLFGSTFEVTDDAFILTREFYLENGNARVWHEGCCGSTHFAKTEGRYPLRAKPEDFGFEPLRDASGEVAP